MRTQVVTWAVAGGPTNTGVLRWEGGEDVPILHDDRTGYVSRAVLGGAALTAVGRIDCELIAAAQREGMNFRGT
jgi:hypothetical protein